MNIKRCVLLFAMALGAATGARAASQPPAPAQSETKPAKPEAPPSKPNGTAPTNPLPASQQPPPAEPPDNGNRVTPTRPPVDDPTVPGDRMRQVLTPSRPPVAGAAAVTRPVVTLRARVIVRDRPAVAMLGVDGKTLAVSKGTEFTTGGGMRVRVLELDAVEVRLELDPLKETITLR